MQCHYCKATISDEAIKCRYCGEWVTKDESIAYSYQPPRSQQPPPPPPVYHAPQPSPSQGQQVNVYVKKPESSTFAVITLILYLFTPLGGISAIIAFFMNIIGMITGPKKGCFVQMFIVFIVIPIGIIIILLAIARDIAENLFDGIERFLPF